MNQAEPVQPDDTRGSNRSSRSSGRAIAALLPTMLSMFAPFFAAAFTWQYIVNTPCWDGWSYISLHEKRIAGTLAFSDLFALHNEHFYFFPLLVFVGLGAITGLDLRVEGFVSHVELLLTLLVMYLAAQRQFGFRLLSIPWWFVPVPFLICNLSQWKNLLCGFQAGFIMSIPCSLLAYHALGRCHLGWFLLASASATVASFSTAMGLAVWPAGMIVLRLVQARRAKLWVWAAVGASEWLTYFAYYRVSPGHTHQVERVLSTVGLSFQEVIGFFIVLLGNPISSNVVQGALLGVFELLSLGACVYALARSGRLRDNAMWLACVAQVLFTCLMISIGRAVLGIDYALEQRYNTHIVPFVVALLMLAASLVTASPFQGGKVLGRAVYGAVLTMVVVSTVPSLLTAPNVGAKSQIAAENQLREAYQGGNAFSELLKRWQRAGFQVDPALTQ